MVEQVCNRLKFFLSGCDNVAAASIPVTTTWGGSYEGEGPVPTFRREPRAVRRTCRTGLGAGFGRGGESLGGFGAAADHRYRPAARRESARRADRGDRAVRRPAPRQGGAAPGRPAIRRALALGHRP